jgi:hypothetical protein
MGFTHTKLHSKEPKFTCDAVRSFLTSTANGRSLLRELLFYLPAHEGLCVW